MLEEVLATWQEYQDYQDVRVLEIEYGHGLFQHLKRLTQELE